MTFRFNSQKATEAAYLFIQREGGWLNVMKLIKLIYLLDRLSIEKRGIPVVGGIYFSMKNGPVTSEILDIVNAGKLAGDENSSWEELISDRRSHMVAIKIPNAAINHISEAEIALIEDIYRAHGAKDQWQIRDWCHENCGEWTPLQAGRDRIEIEHIARQVGKSEAEVVSISEQAEESNLLGQYFSTAAAS